MTTRYFGEITDIENYVLSDTSGIHPPGRTGYYPRVLSYTIGLDAAGTIAFQDGATPITGPMPVVAGGMLHARMNPLGHFQAVGGSLVLVASAGEMNGHMTIEWCKKHEVVTVPPVVFISSFLDPKLLAFWQFENAFNIGLDGTGGTNLPILSGSPSLVAGKHNLSMRLQPGDALEAGFDPVMLFNLNAWTVFGWVRVNDPMSDFTLLSNWHGPDQRSWGVFHNGHRFRAAYSTDGDVDIRRTTNNVNTQSMAPGTWVFVSARYNAVLGQVQIQATEAGDPIDPNPIDMTFGPPFDNTPNGCLSIGTELSPSASADADFDSMGLLNFWASDADIEYIYNGGAGLG